jgi:hypothetical protein
VTETANAAALENIGTNEWQVSSPEGKALVKLTGAEARVLGPAAASLVADYGYPRGDWVQAGPGRYNYIPR